jgi:hypothetical protein
MKAFNLRLNLLAVCGAGGVFTAGQAGHKGLKALQANVIQALQFQDGFGMVVDPDVERRIVLAIENKQRRSLFAALVAASGLTGRKCRQQALRKRQSRISRITVGRGLNHLRASQHVASHRKPITHRVPAPVNAFGARVGSSPTQRVNHVKLPVCATAVSGQKLNQQLGRHALLGHAGERGRSQQGVDKRLGCQGTDTALGMRTQGTYCKKFAGNGDAKVAVGVTRNDGPCHKFFSIDKTRIFQKEVFNKATASPHLEGVIIMV